MTEISFDGFPADGIAFLRDLTINNNRLWFQENRTLYISALDTPAKLFLTGMEQELTRRFGRAFKGKIFRLHRDLRFSIDKTPYNTHLRMAFFEGEGAQAGQAFYFSLEPEGFVLGGGTMGFSASGLESFRRLLVDEEKGASIDDLLSGLVRDGFRLEPPELKRVPAGFDKAHPREALLRRKSLTLWRDFAGHHAICDDTAVAVCAGVFDELKPLCEVLREL